MMAYANSLSNSSSVQLAACCLYIRHMEHMV
eukprot:CAMPEP_0172670590 /NCGR_PEP_ID=MMETSP1074-20121228/10391_1 /TAXON_ID=2916 /ORGANISM="Ceratium fusus, Strain PA161109" /LENGTH=30 /DNA_ID= /DNA_START= /DNA_END= /DNA_ORIENTATION=